ncbi:glycosyltransferase, partial [Arthrobacter sp.]|uniref:glycosyltransferase n=1 Tax=Arthrobacter sp. TaxID=1667 RepID=UPI0025861370
MHQVRRVAMLSLHTSPLDQPGGGDAGGMNVYVRQLALELAAAGILVDIYTRRTCADQPDTVALAPAVSVHHVTAGPFGKVSKESLPELIPQMADAVSAHIASLAALPSMPARQTRGPDAPRTPVPEGVPVNVVHSHYWVSGMAGILVARNLDLPLVHTMHTMARVKNLHLAEGDTPEPAGREIGEVQVVEAADRL